MKVMRAADIHLVTTVPRHNGGMRTIARSSDRRRLDRHAVCGRNGLLDCSAQPSRALTWALSGVAAGLGVLSLAGLGSSVLAGYFARRVVTPERTLPENLSILALIRSTGAASTKTGGSGWQIVLPATEETVAPGVYGLIFSAGAGRARIGQVVSWMPGEGTVTREVEEVYEGDLRSATRGRFTGAIIDSPAELDALLAARDLPKAEVPGPDSSAGMDPVAEQWQELVIGTPAGPAPAWLVRAPEARRIATTAVIVHGRGTRKNEGLRAVPVARSLGMDCLLVSYRNDGEAPRADAGRYGLGLTEWQDVEAAIGYALGHGAKDVVIFGYSMGGAIALQLADRSRYRQRITALVLDGPVVDWVDVLAYQAELNRIPAVVGRYGQLMLSHSLGGWITGLSAPVDFQQMDWTSRAEQLRTPTLIVHSTDDTFVPYGPSMELARKNPEMVSVVEFARAGHTREWNVDPVRWEREVAGWLTSRLARYELPRGFKAPASEKSPVSKEDSEDKAR